MTYLTFPPSPGLRHVVRYFWALEGKAHKDTPYIHRTLATGCPELLFHYKGCFEELEADQVKASFITGIHGQTGLYRRFRISEDFGIFGVLLYPHAISALFDLPAMEIRDELPDLHLLLRREDNHLEEQMLYATDNHERLQIIITFLERKVKPFDRPEIAFAVQSILHAGGEANISKLSDQCSLSVRQFERKFKEHTGFTPKLFSRITRFNTLMGKPFRNKSMAEIAYDFGYYDQAHFISNFKEFSGYSPKTYFSGKAEELQYFSQMDD